METIYRVALFEHRFWLQILGDHARIIFNALSPKETQEIQMAQYFINVFDELLATARQPLSDVQLAQITEQALIYAEQLRVFKLHLLERQLVGEIGLGLPPTFINHMVNELEVYTHILQNLVIGQIPPAQNPIEHHLIWIIDAAGHAAAIGSRLDITEKEIRNHSKEFEEIFQAYYLKAVEMRLYMRTCICEFPALNEFNTNVENKILCFMEFLMSLLEKELGKRVLGALYPLLPDHMLREECYYLIKLAQVSNVNQPDCDPTSPRIEV